MTILQVILLALVQGVTEFLPISSSAHLILTPYLFDWPDQGLTFDVAVNTGTLLAVLVYFRRDLAELARGLWSGLGRRFSGAGEAGDAGGEPVRVEGMRPLHLVLALVLGTIPVGVVALLFFDFFADEARNPLLIAVTSIVFGLLLGVADRWGRRRRELGTLTLLDAFLIGASQAVALLPGTSRSGITMTTALLLGFRRPAAARFSFLLYIPVGLLAAAKDAQEIVTGGADGTGLGLMLLGLAVAAVSAYLVMGWLLAWLERQTMMPFVVYRVALGIVILVVAL